MKTRVHFVVPDWEDPSEWQSCVSLLDSLRADGVEVSVGVVQAHREVAYPYPVSAPQLMVHQRRHPWDIPALFRLARWLRQREPTVVHLWNAGAWPDVWQAVLGSGQPAVVSQGISDSCGRGLGAWYRAALLRRSLVFADPWDNPPPALAAVESGTSAPPAVRESTLPSAVDWIAAEISSQADADLRRDLGVGSQDYLIGLCGRLDVRGGIKDAIWSADLLKVVRDDTHLLIVGDGPHRWRLGRFTRQVRIADRVHFLGRRRLQDWLPYLACFWQPQRAATAHSALLAAMWVGIPVIATDLPQHRRWIEDGRNGCLFQAGNRAKLAQSTLRLLDDAAYRAAIATEAMTDLRRRISVSARSQACQRLYCQHAR